MMAARGIASRRECESMIRMGRVKVNGIIVTELGVKVNPEEDRIEVDGIPIPKKKEKIYVLLYKPAGTITTAKDPQGRKTVLDLIKDIDERLYPVGRLDYETEGALLLTNDGDLTNRLLHPRYEVEKEYLVQVKGELSREAITRLTEGVPLEDGVTSPAKYHFVKMESGYTWFTLSIHEGRNRIVRRMCAAVGFPVVYLRRIRIAFLTLDGLRKGEYRYLTDEEVIKLKEITEPAHASQIRHKND